MGFFKGNQDVPDELPDLAINQIKEELKKEIAIPSLPVAEKVTTPKVEEVKQEIVVKESLKKEEIITEKEAPLEKKRMEIESEKSFFNQILQDINEEITDVDSLEKWYEKKFITQDVVDDMKGYWEGQKKDLVLKSLGQSFKERINDNIKKLQQLETDWQNVYFDLIEKEEEMKEQEKELRRIISEFIEVGKRRTMLNTEGNSNEKQAQK